MKRNAILIVIMLALVVYACTAIKVRSLVERIVRPRLLLQS